MSDNTHDHFDDDDDEIQQSSFDVKKIIFIAICASLIIGGICYKFLGDNEPEPKTNDHAHTSLSDVKSVSQRQFEFKDDAPPPPPPPPKNDAPPPPKDDAPPPPPPPPKDDVADAKTKAAPIIKKRILDKSSSSMVVEVKTQGGLGIVPKDHQTTANFDLYAKNSNQGGQGGQALGGLLNTSATQNSVAAVLYNRDFLLAKGAYIDCVLNTAMNSTVAGMTKCTLTRNVYSDNGTTLLLERGSEVTGEYRANLAQGQARLFVLWDRVKTPHGVVVNLASPATDSLGAGGVGGHVETHFWKRFGGAMMLSLVDDFAAYAATNGGKNVNNFESSSDAAQNMAAEALKNTINIPPTFEKNQGSRVGIFIARDIDFSSVYQLKVTR